jgi:ureidoglycolate lyase
MNGPALRLLQAEPLTRERFAPYGQVIECADHADYEINGGTSRRFSDLAQLETDAAGRLALSIFRAHARKTPYLLTAIERHPLGSQAFMPLDGQAFLIVVAEQPTPGALRAFLSDGRQGINFRCGVWHHPLLALTAGDFLVADRLGPGENCEALDIADWRVAIQP